MADFKFVSKKQQAFQTSWSHCCDTDKLTEYRSFQIGILTYFVL